MPSPNNELLIGSDGSDTTSGGTGNDTLYGGGGEDSLSGGTEVRVNPDGLGDDFFAIATLQGVSGQLLEDLVARGNLITSS